MSGQGPTTRSMTAATRQSSQPMMPTNVPSSPNPPVLATLPTMPLQSVVVPVDHNDTATVETIEYADDEFVFGLITYNIHYTQDGSVQYEWRSASIFEDMFFEDETEYLDACNEYRDADCNSSTDVGSSVIRSNSDSE